MYSDQLVRIEIIKLTLCIKINEQNFISCTFLSAKISASRPLLFLSNFLEMCVSLRGYFEFRKSKEFIKFSDFLRFFLNFLEIFLDMI